MPVKINPSSRHPRQPLPHIEKNPFTVVVERGGAPESEHLVDLAVVDCDGHVVLAYGDIERTIFPRSAMKPLQAIAVVELLQNLPEKGLFSDAELSLITASHNGEEIHVDGVHALLSRFGLDAEQLACGAHWSLDKATGLAQARAMERPSKAHNNCSGKHAGMLILGHLMDVDLKGYHQIEHPVQQRILGVMEQMSGVDFLQYPSGVDGCGAPALSGPLGNWARGFAVFANRSMLPDGRARAIEAIRDGVAAAPLMIAGTGRCCSAVADVYGSLMTVKTGAEGVYAAAFHDLGLGLLLKVRDGHNRGAEFALGAVLHKLGYNDDKRLKSFFKPVLKNWSGDVVGKITLPTPQSGMNSRSDN
ncbi:MAG: asparaginase [Parvularculales bacterium]